MIEDDFHESEEFQGSIHMGIKEALALRDLLQYFIKMWPGSPARPAEEQEYAHGLLQTVNQIILEHSFTFLDVDHDRRKEDRGEGE